MNTECNCKNVMRTFCSIQDGAQSEILCPCSKSLLDPGVSYVPSTTRLPKCKGEAYIQFD